MANYDSMMVTTKRFRVKDYAAFKEEMAKNRVYENNLNGIGLSFSREEDGTVWVGGYDAYFTKCVDWHNGKEIDLIPIIQKHMTPDSVAIVNTIAHEVLRCAEGMVHVITPTACVCKTLDEMGGEIAERLFIATLPKKVKTLCGARAPETV